MRHPKGQVVMVPRPIASHCVLEGFGEAVGWEPTWQDIGEAARASMAQLAAEAARRGED